MSKYNSASKIEIKGYDDLFGKVVASETMNTVIDIPLEDLHGFKNHPFKMHKDVLEEMVDSIKKHGVLMPGICRRDKDGYEIISGHTRCEACRIIGLKSMPMIEKELSDEEATIIMVDSNIQRDDVLISEKAKAYKMRYNAMKRPGVKGDSLAAMSEETGENAKKIQRYIWLARLNDYLLDMVDEKKLPVTQALDLSFLNNTEQKIVIDVMSELHLIPTMQQTSEMKLKSKECVLDRNMILSIICSTMVKKTARKVTIKANELSRYFDEDVTEKEIAEIIIQLLEERKRKEEEYEGTISI